MEKLVTVLPNNEWWMARKRVYVQNWQLSSGFALSHLTKQYLFSSPRKRLILIKKILHFSVSILMLNSDRMVLLHSKHKILCSWFLSHSSYSDVIYHAIEIPTSYLNFEVQKLLKATLKFGNHFDENHIQKQKVGILDVYA